MTELTENAKVLHKNFIDRKDTFHAAQLEKKWPELKQAVPEVKEDGKKPKGRTKRTGNS